MSDFFMSTQNNYENEQQAAAKFRSDVANYQNKDIETFKQKKQEHYENWNRYGVEVPDEHYEVFNKIISQAASPEEAQEEAYKIGSAVKYSRMMNIPLEEAYKNVDAYNEAMFSDMQGQKGRFEALCDMLNLGENNVKLGKLGQQLMSAHQVNDPELADTLMVEIDAINQQNVLMQDNAPRTWVMEALEAGAQSLPFTVRVAGAGIIGNFVAPAVGTGAAFLESSYLSAGQEYLDMLANGASPKTARTVALVSGGLQGIIEADLGITKGIVKGGARLIGKEVAEDGAKKALEEIGRKVFKKFHFGAGKKLLINYLENYGKNVLGEGVEEFLQEFTSIVGQEIAASIDGYDIPDDDAKAILKQCTEAARGGILGALSMGFVPAGINAAADIKEFRALKENAEAFESSEMFKEAVKDSPVFEGMSDEYKSEVIQQVWARAQERKEFEANEEAKSIAEVRDAAEGAQEQQLNEEGEITESEAVARDESGKLMFSDDENVSDDGSVSGNFRAGDKSKAENNRYGYINYTTDENNKTVTIDDFKMTQGREGLRGELFDEFARKYAGYNIEWNTKSSEAASIKESLIEKNPSGAKAGLNYYANTNAVSDAATRAKVAAEIKKNIHNVSVSYDEMGNKSFKRTELSNKQTASAVALLEAAAKRIGMNLSEYVDKTFGSQIFGTQEDFSQMAQAQGDSARGKAGGVNPGMAQKGWQQFGQQVKAVIYAGENADFSTWAHELAHIFQNQLDGDLKQQAEAAFGVQNGDWINSKYTFKDGHTDSAAEAFAYGFQDWLKTGKAESEEMKNVFQKFAEFIVRAFNSLKDFINLTPEIESVYNQLLSGDDSLLKQAENAVEEGDRRYRADMKRKAEEQANAKKAAEEQQRKAQEAERDEMSETTEEEQEREELTPEAAEKKLEEVANENEEKGSAIDDALESVNLTNEEKIRLEEILKDENSSVVEKAEAATDAASSVYDDVNNDVDPNLFYQLAGEVSIRRMAEGEEKERMLADLDAAKLLDERYKSMDQASKASRIRMMTGWEKDATGRWKFELDDSVNRIIGGVRLAEVLKNAPEMLNDDAVSTMLNLGDIMDAPELYKVFPYMKSVRVSFYSDPNAFRAVLTPQGIKVNTRYLQGVDGEKGLKGVLAHEIQHVIQAMEFADSKGLQGQNIEQLYNDMMAAMQAAGERKYDYDITSLKNGLDAYMQDAGEIEARNVARRILMNANERRYNTLASTEDVKRQPGLLFQDDITEEELNNYFSELKPSEESIAYKKEYYDDVQDLYEEKTFVTSDGNKLTLNAPKARKPKQHEIDEAYYLQSKEYKVAFLNEPRNNEGVTHPDLLLNDNIIVELKQITGNANTAAKKIREAINKTGVDVPVIFFMDKAVELSNDEVLENLEKDTHIKREVDNVVIIRNYNNISLLNKKASGVANATARRTSTIAQELESVKQEYQNTDGNFDDSNPNILFQIAGEIGAQNLDNSEEVKEGVSRMQNLAIAKQMEAAGEDVQKIRLATSWEKSSDGKWRYEIDDSKFKTDFLYKSFNFRQQYPRYNELEKKLEENNFDWDKLTKAEQTEFDELGDILNRMYYKEDLVLSDVLDARELYAAYPMLKDVPIKFTKTDYSKGYEGQMRHGIALFELDDGTYDKQSYYEIEINSIPDDYNSERIRSTLFHEIQHIIQRLEGFATGGNLNLAGKIIEKNNEQKRINHNKALAWAWRNELIATEKEHPGLRGTTKVMDALLEEYKEDNYDIKRLEEEGWIPEEDVRIKGFNLYVRGYDNEGYEDAYNEWSKNIAGFKPEIITDWAKERIYKRFAGEVESRNVQSRLDFTPEQRINTLLAATEDVRPEDKIILFQTVYHGSGADFDKFDTEKFGLSGEGSMTFGYGTYVTDDEEIARDYAERQRKRTLNKESTNPYERGSLEYEMFEDLRSNSFNFSKSLYKKYLEKEVENIKKDPNNPYQDFKASEKLAIIDNLVLGEEDNKTNLYTVEIPDAGYLSFNEPITNEILEKIAPVYTEELYKRWLNDSEWQDGFTYTDQQKEGVRKHFEEDILSLNKNDDTYDGEQLYRHIQKKLEYYDRENADKLASKLLNKAGFIGIKYPAGIIHGNGNGAYNYVIFNDEDAKIVDHLFYQTEAELMNEAQSFEDWQSFMEYCEAMHSMDEVSPIPYSVDAQWFQTFWEKAHGVQAEQEENNQIVSDKIQREGALPGAVDALFATYIRSNPEMLDNFLNEVAQLDAIDLDSEEWAQVEDEEGAKQRERIDQLKDFIGITLRDYNWQTAIKRVQGGHEIAEGLRKRLIGEMLDNFKIRDFRALYSEIMGDGQFAVDEADSTIAQLNKKLSKYKKTYDILKPGEDISRVSPERRKRIAEALQNREIAEKIKNGSLKLDDEIESYLKSLDKQVKDLQREYNELEKGTQNDYQRIADAERRKLLKLHEELLLARGRMTSKDSEINRKINKGLKITEKYQRESQNLKANYNELFRKFTDLKNTIQITAEVQAALDRQERVAGLKEDLNTKQKEKSLMAEVKKMRIQLVKRTMRRVPFNRIDYDNARTVIAIQRMLEPNLLGGVNRFIGIDSAFLRGVVSQIVTDSEYKEKILSYLRKQNKSSQAFVDFVKKIEELKSIKDFDSWSAKERKYAIKHLPKENWVRDLNLLQLAKEREESIDLDIEMVEKQVPRIDPKTGEAMTDKDGNIITETAFVLDYDDELGKLVQDAVGANMFDLIINKPFSEWTTEELEKLAQRIDELYTQGRDMFAAKAEARKREADNLRNRIENAIKETGITINDDDTPEEKKRKAEKIAKILNRNSGIKGTEAGKESGLKAKFDRLINGYWDANVLRVARILDNYSEGENVRLLYRMEDESFNKKTRSIMARGEAVKKVMADNKITEASLAESVRVSQLGTEFTIDELLYFLAADKDFELDDKGKNDDWAATSRNAVMFGNMMSDSASQEQKEYWAQLDKDMQELIDNDALTPEQKQLQATGELDTRPGTSNFRRECHERWDAVLEVANSFIEAHPEYKALMEAIEADYASQYERMNEISINEFNTPVHRVRAYVPLVRRESNGDTNVNQVKEDLLGAYGADAGKQWVNKGMTKRRTNISPLNQKPVQTGLFRTWGDSIERTEHFIAYAPYVRQLNAVYKSRDANYTRRFIEARYGKQMLEYIDNYINEVANPNANKVREKGAELLHLLRGRTAPAYLGWKFSGILKQGLTSPWPYMQFVNPAEYLAAATKCWTSGGKFYDAIKSKSAYMASRVMDPINELVDEMAENAKSKLDRSWSKFAKAGMQGLEWIDWTCVAPGWLACYQKEYNRLQAMSEARFQEKKAELTEKNMNAEVGTSEWMSSEKIESIAMQQTMDDIESEAVRYADDCTRACQPSSRLTDLAPLFKNSSEAMKAFLQFQTSLNVIWQNIRYDIPYNIRQKQYKNIVGTVCGYVLAGVFMNSVMDGVKGDDDDDWLSTQTLRNLIFYSTTQFTDSIPMIGSDITNMMDQVITGKRGFAQSGTDMTPSATKLMSALQKATSGDFKKAAALTAEGIGLGLGAPVSGTKEIYKLLGKPLSEGDVNIARGVGDVYGLAGDIIGEE